MIVDFVDIGGIVDHHCLNFLFITLYTYCTGTTVCIMWSRFSEPYHYEMHSVEKWCSLHNWRNMIQTIILHIYAYNTFIQHFRRTKEGNTGRFHYHIFFKTTNIRTFKIVLYVTDCVTLRHIFYSMFHSSIEGGGRNPWYIKPYRNILLQGIIISTGC
jgi:hypothetical protein